MSENPIVLRGLGDVVALLPHLVGTQVNDSIVVVPVELRAAPVARVDLPATAQDREIMAAHLAPYYAEYRTPVVLLAFTDRRDLAEAACDRLAEAFDSVCPIAAAASVTGDRWVRLDHPDHGTVSPASRDRVAAEAIYQRGSSPYRSLQEHRASFAPGSSQIPAQDFAAAQTATSTVLQDPPALAQERAWMSLVVGRHIASSTPLPTVDAARMLADVQDIGLRDHAWTLIPRDEARQHAELWKDLLTRAPEGAQAPAAALAAFSYWVAGDGLSARAALEQIPPTQQYSMGQLITVAVRNGLDPKAFPMPHDMPPDVAAGVPAPSSGSEQARRQPPMPASTSPFPGVSR